MDKLSQSVEDYLEAIYLLDIKNDKIRSTHIATILNVSKPAVNKAMNELIDRGFITKESYSEIILTDLGREYAVSVYERHIALKTFLINIGVPQDIAESDSCKLEHSISPITYDKICQFNSNIKQQ